MAEAGDAIGVDLEALAVGALGDAAMSSPGPVDGFNETVEITIPQSTYDSRGRSSLGTVLPHQ